MGKSFLISIMYIIEIVLNVMWAYHMNKAIPLRRTGGIDRVQLKRSLVYLVAALALGIIGSLLT